MDAPLKKILRALSLELRHTLEGTYSEDGTWNAGDLERRLNQIGIWREEERKPKPISEMPNLSPVDRKAREMIDAYLALRNDAGVSQTDAVAEFIRESAYSWANRLFALRCMEARGIIDPVILQEEAYGGRSMVHNRFAQRNPSKCTSEDDGLFAMLSEEFQEHSKELPDLFAPDSPAVTLRPSVASLKKCIGMLSGSVPANGARATDEVFTAPDAFGWAYQYWNAEEKDRVFEKVRTKKGAKIEGADIIPATQLYTEPYMVKFLVQNSLGATWMMMHPESKISTSWEYYVKDADRAPADKKPVAEITFLDPACGSGHFHIEAFDLLYAMYEEEGLFREPASICHSILNNNLFGIDIDERAVQITKAVLWMKAAETVFAKTKKPLNGDGFSEFHDHIIATNIRLPKGKDHLDAFLKKHPDDTPLRPALLTVFEGLQNVHELGSLVQIEEPVEKELKVLKEQAKQQKFDPESMEVVEKVNFSRWKQQVIKRLKAHFQDEAEKALPTEAFFSQSAVKGLALFDLLARRYDVVAANPPYMGLKNFGATVREYLSNNYVTGKGDLSTSFLLRNSVLTLPHGYVSMVTLNSWLFLSNFSNLRKEILSNNNINDVVLLGRHAFESIDPPSDPVLFTFQKGATNNHCISSIRINQPNLSMVQGNLLLDKIGKENSSFSKSSQKEMLELPNSIFSINLGEQLSKLFHSSRKMVELLDIVAGISTGNNSRFLRYHWETNSTDYSWYSKGRGYCKWIGNLIDVANYEKIKIFIKDSHTGAIRNEKFFFKEGGTYTENAKGKLGARIVPKNTFFDAKGNGIFSKTDQNTFYQGLSILNTRYASFFLRGICPTSDYDESYVRLVPWPNSLSGNCHIAKCCISLKQEIISKNIIEIYDNSNKLSLLKLNDDFFLSAILLTLESLNEVKVYQQLQLSPIVISQILNETGTPSGFYPLIINYNTLPRQPDKLVELPTEVITYLNEHDCVSPTFDEITDIRKRLHYHYQAGSGVKAEVEDEESLKSEDDGESLAIGGHIPIPAETFLEELSQKMKIHPISIYWLLKEGIEKEGWRCISEEKHYTEDLFTVIVLRLLGHRWPKQIEAGEPVPEWADADGIIPITSGLTHPTLFQQVRNRIGAEFPGGKVHEIEKNFEEVIGMPLERWLAGEFFKHHISQFKKRPIAWQISSSPSGTAGGKGKGKGSRREPAFSCLVYYHKIDADILHKIRTQYVGDLINRYGTELRALEGRSELTGDQATRKVQLDNWIAELNDFSKTLQDVADSGFESPELKEIVKKEPLDKWTSRDGKVSHPKSSEEFHAQEKRYDPDINDGVRVNIIPLQKAGLLSADVIAKKDVEKAIADRAEWRADERRWCREGKLRKCGWWK